MYKLIVNKTVEFPEGSFKDEESTLNSVKKQDKLSQYVSRYFNHPAISVDSMVISVKLHISSEIEDPEVSWVNTPNYNEE